jgi:hypothetical protein
MILELIICSLLMPPFINIEVPLQLNGVEVVYTLDMMVSSLILLKSYLLLRVYEHVSKWTNLEAKKTTLPFYISTIIFNFESNYTEPRLKGKWEEYFN